MTFIYSYSYIFTIIGYITNSQLNIYPCGLIAQWIEHCTGIAWVRIPFKPEFYPGCFFNCLSWKHTARIIISLDEHCRPPLDLSHFITELKFTIFPYLSSSNCFNFCRYFSEEPHLAGSPRQKELADELAKRWKSYGFDHVEQPEYKVLLSFPNTQDPTKITIKYTNGTKIHEISGDKQV